MTIEAVGEFLGLSQDLALYRYFRQHYRHFFPAMAQVCRTTFVRQAANLWWVKERVWQMLLRTIRHDPALSIVDSFPLPVCRFARANRCQRFRGEAAFGRDEVARQTCYGFRVHLRLSWPGLITGFSIAPANVHDLAMVPELAVGTQGILLGDRNYWSPPLVSTLGRGVAPPGPDLAGPLQVEEGGPLAAAQLPTQPAPLPYRNRVQSIGGALSSQASPGQGPLASVRPVAA